MDNILHHQDYALERDAAEQPIDKSTGSARAQAAPGRGFRQSSRFVPTAFGQPISSPLPFLVPPPDSFCPPKQDATEQRSAGSLLLHLFGDTRAGCAEERQREEGGRGGRKEGRRDKGSREKGGLIGIERHRETQSILRARI